VYLFFFQADDGIRGSSVTGVQTCALPIYDDVRLNRIHLFDRFWRGIERENLVTLFPAKCHDDFDHCRLVIDDYDLSHSQRGEYFNFEKKKEETGKNLISVGDFTMEHDPWNLADKIENCLVNDGRVSKRYTDHICQKIR